MPFGSQLSVQADAFAELQLAFATVFTPAAAPHAAAQLALAVAPLAPQEPALALAFLVAQQLEPDVLLTVWMAVVEPQEAALTLALLEAQLPALTVWTEALEAQDAAVALAVFDAQPAPDSLLTVWIVLDAQAADGLLTVWTEASEAQDAAVALAAFDAQLVPDSLLTVWTVLFAPLEALSEVALEPLQALADPASATTMKPVRAIIEIPSPRFFFRFMPFLSSQIRPRERIVDGLFVPTGRP
jgi:hypothetical protein